MNTYFMCRFIIAQWRSVALLGVMFSANIAYSTVYAAETNQDTATSSEVLPNINRNIPPSVLRSVNTSGGLYNIVGTLPSSAVRFSGDPVSLFAQTRQKASLPSSGGGWMHWHYMFGDWGGVRKYLSNHGVDIGFYWMSEPAGNPVGGRKQDVKFTQHWDANMVVDMGRLLGWQGGTFKFHVINRSGGGLSDHVIGNWMTVQQIYGAGQDNRVAELSYTQLTAHKRLELKVGYSPIGNDFGREIYGCDFMNVALCAHPMTLSYDSGWRNNPKGQWGFKIRGNLPQTFYVSTGIYQSDQYNGRHDNGFKLTFTGTGVVVPFEAGWEPDKRIGMLPGHYRIGGYYDNSHLPDAYYNIYNQPAGIFGKGFRLDKGHYGFYGMFDQQLTKFDNDPNRGIVIWGGAGYSNPQMSVAVYQIAAQASVLFLGPFRSRPKDLIGLAWGYLEGNPRHQDYLQESALIHKTPFMRATHEQLVEIDYGAEITPWLNLRPNLQYIIHPSGMTKYNDAFVIGADTKMVF
ncbi:carbohydrate porin [Gluconobacter kondonii]|uniref:Porin n=1 Tax=Gluconobacter kondonii TaxID=941463 RepID=A0ABQ5WSV1_9PROT|nr:carbohydrate porin [Gluconobacter kondonii]GLQ66600.1 porin [Gluconobacter kondonii]